MKHPREFFGLPMQQNEHAMLAINRLLIDLRPSQIIEIGTGCGGLSCFLGIYAKNHGAEFATFDIKAPPPEMRDPMSLASVHPLLGSVWHAELSVASMIGAPGPTLVLCDGGDKPREFRTFSKYLKPGDVICAHDYPSDNWECVEIDADDVNLPGLEPYHAEDMMDGAWACRRKE